MHSFHPCSAYLIVHYPPEDGITLQLDGSDNPPIKRLCHKSLKGEWSPSLDKASYISHVHASIGGQNGTLSPDAGAQCPQVTIAFVVLVLTAQRQYWQAPCKSQFVLFTTLKLTLFPVVFGFFSGVVTVPLLRRFPPGRRGIHFQVALASFFASVTDHEV